MSKRPTPAAKFVPMDEGLPPDPDAPITDPDAPITDPDAPITDPDAPITEPELGSDYEQAVAFEPETWDQLPEDPAVRRVYVALNGQINFFIKRRA